MVVGTGILAWFPACADAGQARLIGMTVYRVELERLDKGYEARIPEIDGFLCEGLTEGATLTLLRQKLDRHIAQLPALAGTSATRLEVFRT